MVDFLLEIAAEEIPASYIEPALDALAKALEERLQDARLGNPTATTCATPRRLVIHVSGLEEKQDSREVELQGPPIKAAFDTDGNPTQAAKGFARKCGVPVDKLSVVEKDGRNYVAARKVVEGKTCRDILAGALPVIIAKLPFPKSMQWNATGFRFARPIRGIVALLGNDVVDFEIAGVTSGRATSGHPFLGPVAIMLPDADLKSYEDALEKQRVIADPSVRKGRIAEGIARHLGLSVPQTMERIDTELLEEVKYLVEFPNVLEGAFDDAFLALPEEVLEEAMKSHQRYFPVRRTDGRLAARFLAVYNRGDEHAEAIRQGNERVLRARLADAQFFWREDTRTKLEAKMDGLSQVVYLQGLGTYAQKSARLVNLADTFAEILGFEGDVKRDAKRAAELAKADLVTQMVFEFPKLQGVMGSYYAKHDGEKEGVWKAIREHYLPRYAEDRIPETPAGTALALADKIDHVLGCFLIGKAPTGSQDPFAVRRAAQGVIRILLEGKHDVGLSELFAPAARWLAAKDETPLEEAKAFVRERLYQMMMDRGEPFDLVRAVLASGFDNLVNFEKRLNALKRLRETPEWPGLVELVERTYNITKGIARVGEVSQGLLAEQEEKELHALYRKHADEVAHLLEKRNYEEGALLYARVFAKPTHEFFEKVYVNVEDEALRANRLALCAAIHRLFATRLADLSDLVVQKAREG